MINFLPRILKIVLLTIFIWIPNSYSANFLTLHYSAKAGDSLKSIVLFFLKDGVAPASANKSLVTTMKKNPEIKVWNPLTKDTIFKLYLDPGIVNLKRYNDYYIEVKKQSSHHLGLSSMPSIGYFSQANTNGFSVKYNQVSFISIGVNYQYAPYQAQYNLSSSFYYSTISAASNQINGASTSVDIPGEYGLTVYGTYKPDDSQFSYFSGFDYESFSSFNLESITLRDTIIIDTNTVTYLTAGLNYRPAFAQKLVLKFSLSKSIMVSHSSALSSNADVKIDGIKLLIFGNYMLNDKWAINAIFKSHNFGGDNDLSINRFGLGLSYSLF